MTSIEENWWDKPILGKLTLTDFAEALTGVLAAIMALALLMQFC